MPAPDILVLSRRTRLNSVARAVRLKKRYGTKLVLDLSENLYFESDSDKPGTRKKRARLPHYVNQFDLVVTPSPYLQNELQPHFRPDMNFRVIPDAVENDPVATEAIRIEQASAFEAYAQFEKEVDGNGIEPGRRLVWFGVAGRPEAKNGMYDLQAHLASFQKHNADKPLSLSIISDDRQRYEALFAEAGFQTHYLDWHFFTINPALRRHDIAVLPIRANPYTLSKSANRITTAFANGLAVCGSVIPSYEPFRGVAVFDDWEDGLARLMADNAERRQRVEQARTIISKTYSLPVIAGEWQKVFASLS
jgi:glycosyltransferase involved in cell wall biosynthesis